jgi:hypothetical protein
MFRTFMIAPAAAAVLALSSTAFAQGQGTPDEAKAHAREINLGG